MLRATFCAPEVEPHSVKCTSRAPFIGATLRAAALLTTAWTRGDGITGDTLLNIARFLPTVKDLLFLLLTCPRFAAKVIAASVDESEGCSDWVQRQCVWISRRRSKLLMLRLTTTKVFVGV